MVEPLVDDKIRLPKAVILSKTRYVGFNRQPVQDDKKNNVITGMPAPSSTYRLLNGRRWVDMEKKP